MNVYIVILVVLMPDDSERHRAFVVKAPDNTSEGDVTAAAYGQVDFDHYGLIRSEMIKLTDATLRNIGLIAKEKNLI